MSDPLHKIKNLKKLAKYLAKNVASDCGFSVEELKEYMTVKNAIQIVKQHAEVNNYGELMINTKILERICLDMSGWLLGVNLAKLASDDLLDCYWDNKKNCMVFKKKTK